MAEAILLDLNGVGAFIKSQQDAGVPQDAILDAQCRSMTCKIRSLKALSYPDATRLTTLVRDGPWTNDQIILLASAVAEMTGKKSKQSAGNQGDGQVCSEFEHFMNDADNEEIEREGVLEQTVVRRIAWRAVSIELKHPSEPTVGRMAAILAAKFLKNPSASIDSLNVLHRAVKKAIQTEAKRLGQSEFPTIYLFPALPTGLDAALQKRAYGDSMPQPVDIEFTHILSQIASQKYLRGSSNALKAQQLQTSACSALANPKQLNQFIGMQPQMAQGMQPQMQLQDAHMTPQMLQVILRMPPAMQQQALQMQQQMQQYQKLMRDQMSDGVTLTDLGTAQMNSKKTARDESLRHAQTSGPDNAQIQFHHGVQKADRPEPSSSSDGTPLQHSLAMFRSRAAGAGSADPQEHGCPIVEPAAAAASASTDAIVTLPETPFEDPMLEAERELEAADARVQATRKARAVAKKAAEKADPTAKAVAKSSKKARLKAAARAAAAHEGSADGDEDADDGDDDDDDDGPVVAAPMKRPAAAKPAGAIMKRPAAAAKAAPKKAAKMAAKRPVAKEPRPKALRGTADDPAPVVHYRGCKISTSWKKMGFRVFLDLSIPNPVDKTLKWHMYPGWKDAFTAGLDMIDNKCWHADK